jgi:hypothetical protein
LFCQLPKLSEIGVKEIPVAHQKRKIIGGERNALKQMALRLTTEKNAFLAGLYRPNQVRPDLLGPSLSLSSAIAVGAVSVRLYVFKRLSKQMGPPYLFIIYFYCLFLEFIGK